MRSYADLLVSKRLVEPARIPMRIFDQILAVHGWNRRHSYLLQTVSHSPLLSRYRPLRQNLIQGVLIGFTVGGCTKSFVMRELRLYRLQATVLDFNTGSARVLAKCGFSEEGLQHNAVFKRGRLHDLRVFAKVRSVLDDA